MTARASGRPIVSVVVGAGCALVFSVLAAPTVRGAEPPGPAKGSQHWAFQRLGQVEVARVSGPARARTPIDLFLLSRMEARRLTFSREADRATLIRRASLDLWGLPPGPEDVDAFLA